MNLVTTEWLEKNLNKIKIFDASWHMPTSKRDAKKEYEEKHIEGAMFWDVDEHSDKDSPYPHMMSNSDYWSKMLWSYGIQNHDNIIVYDYSDTYSSCRLWFALKYFGHQKVSVLDGGMKKWLKENRATSKEVNQDLGRFRNIDKLNPKMRYKVNENAGWIKNKKQIDENIKKTSFQTIDARSRERFEGKVDEPRPGLKRGCIMDSKNIPFKDCINPETNTFKTKDQLSKIFAQNKVDTSRPIVFTCGSGMTACVLGMAYSIISGKNAMLYDGSWSEYGKK
ncbi:MAG: sulfurtransferase [Candidatus Marinimicrobia bacterium]|nr:sulfurtransferase [Candidatus Neomarinimicrobiota bacterium]|tara:strand:+ start:2360 stop:3199 length:840 start_codon:yes stop_codon:yes gene_type:complete